MKSHLRILTLSIMAVIPPFAHAQEVGTLSVFMLKEGKPLAKNEIVIDAQKTIYTDSDGSAKVTLTIGEHQVEIYAKGTNGSNLGYFKKPVTIKAGKDTQVVASFTMDEPEIDIDTPLGNMESDAQKEKKLKAKGTGTLNGRVVTSDKAQPIVGARVFVKGTSIDARTDDNGNFSVQIPADSDVSVSVVHSAYSAQTLSDIKVEKDGSITKIIKLTPASLELEEFVVLAPKIEGSIADIMTEEKEISAIANILGSEEFSKKGDGDAAAALKRVTGVTLVGGKNIYVRGLGERYSNIEMNSMPLPSPDPTRRTVPLDIFPSSVIGSLKVQKSGSADIPSSFGGGYVDIRTKDKSDEDFIKISMGASGNTNTGEQSNNYVGSETDWMGYDNGYRAILNGILDAGAVTVGERVKGFTTDYFTEEELISMTKDYVDRNYNIHTRELPVGLSGSIEAAKSFDIKEDHKVSLSGNYGYSQDHQMVEEQFYGYDMSSNGTLYTTPSQSGTNNKVYSSYYQGGSLNVGYNYLDLLKLKYTKLYTRNAQKATRVVDGIMGSNYDHLIKYYLDWEERVLDVNQFNGEFDYELFNQRAKANFGLEYAQAHLYQPNNFHYAYIEEGGKTFTDNTLSNHLAKRLKSDDTLYAAYIKSEVEVPMLSDEDKIEVGANISSKERISRQNKFFLRSIGGTNVKDSDMDSDIESVYYRYVRNDIPFDERPFLVSPLFTPADYFDAEVDEWGLFTAALIKPVDDIEVNLGVRYVNLNQTVYQYQEDSNNPDMTLRRLIQRIPESLEVNDYYPSLNVKYKYNEENQFDVAVSKTYIIPDLREFTSGEYFHPYDVATIVGNPNLKNTDIYSLDLKYSYFISDTENVKFGLFYKILDKPIEDVMLPSSSLPIYSYDNADKAELYGVEVDGRKNFDFLGDRYSNYYVSGNFSYTESDVTLRPEQIGTYSTNHRQLQGLSNIVVNATLGYDNEDRNIALSYNKMGERIRKVGLIDAGDAYPDNFETPPQLLDFVWTEKIKNLDSYGLDELSLKLKVGNLLDEETVWKQGNNVTQRFKTGQTFGIGISSKF